MRWEDERYIRIFTRDTPTWDAMGWEAQALLMLVLRKMDRTGLLELGNSGVRGLAACVRMPVDVVERSLRILLDDGVLSMVGTDVFCKNFLAAQDCAKSDSLRSREKRERAHLGLTQSVSRVTRVTRGAPRGDTTVPQSDTPSVPSVPDPLSSLEASDPDPERARVATDGPNAPIIARNLIHWIKIEMERNRPDRGMYFPGPFADRDAGELIRSQDSTPGAAAEVKRRIALFVADDRMAPWTVAKFCKEFNGIGATTAKCSTQQAQAKYSVYREEKR